MPFAENCAGCPYRAYGRAIGPRGDPASRIAVVGEAPGGTEMIVGEPFRGRAGEVLGRALIAVQLPEEALFITNAVGCQPRPTKPSVKAINACRGRLAQDIQANQRTVIITLGATAFRAVTGDAGFRMRDIRGREYTASWGSVVVPTLHPAYVLRRRATEALLVEDLAHARHLADRRGREVAPPATNP